MLTRTEFYDGDALIVGFVLFLLAEEVGGGDKDIVGHLYIVTQESVNIPARDCINSKRQMK